MEGRFAGKQVGEHLKDDLEQQSPCLVLNNIYPLSSCQEGFKHLRMIKDNDNETW